MTTTEAAAQSLSIGEVAERTGLSVHALRFYEREGLLVGPVQRTSGGRRRYTSFDVDWLLICVKLRESGMPLADLKHFAELVRHGPGNEAERLSLLDAHRQRVDAQIRALEECRFRYRLEGRRLRRAPRPWRSRRALGPDSLRQARAVASALDHRQTAAGETPNSGASCRVVRFVR